MSESEYEVHGVVTSGAEPLRLPPMTECVCCRKRPTYKNLSTCLECENVTRKEIRLTDANPIV